MKRILTIVALFVWSAVAFAQDSQIPHILEIAQIETESGFTAYQVIDVLEEGQHHYFLDVGTLGFGDEVIQVYIDPLFHLFIPLGDTLAGAKDRLHEMQALFKEKGATLEVTGSLSPAFPGEKYEPVKVTSRKVLLSRILEFSVEREGYIRAAHVSRSDFNPLVAGVKIYSKIHPKEK